MNTNTLLLDFIDEFFDLDEIKTIFFHLDVDFDNLAGTTKQAKVRELIKFMQRTHKDGINQLINIVVGMRPERFAERFAESPKLLDWDSIKPQAQSPVFDSNVTHVIPAELNEPTDNFTTSVPNLSTAKAMLKTIRLENGPVSALEWITKSLVLAFCAESRELLLVSTVTGQVRARYERLIPPIGLYYIPKRNLLVTWSSNQMSIESFENEALKHVWQQHFTRLNDVAISRSARLLACVGGTTDGFGRVIKVSNFGVNNVYSPKPLLQVAISPTDNLLAAISADQQVLVWDSSTGRLIRQNYHDGKILAIIFTSVGSSISIFFADGRVLIQRVSDNVAVASNTKFSPSHIGTHILYRLSANVLAHMDDTIYIWSDMGDLLYSLQSKGKVLCARDSPDYNFRIALGTDDGSLIITEP